MFDFFRRHMKVLQFVLILLVFPSFVFFGIEGYSRYHGGEADAVAMVDGHAISRSEWDAALREQIERARQQMPGVDVKLFETPEVKRLSLDSLIRERVMLAAANQDHLVTTDDRLQRLFVSDPQFASIRNPDGSVNRELLAAQGMSSEIFAQRLRQELSTRQVMLGHGRQRDRAVGGCIGRARCDVPAARGAGAALRREGLSREGHAEPRPTSSSTTRTRPTPRSSRRPSTNRSNTSCSTSTR